MRFFIHVYIYVLFIILINELFKKRQTQIEPNPSPAPSTLAWPQKKPSIFEIMDFGIVNKASTNNMFQ